jgi:hypothetical protein
MQRRTRVEDYAWLIEDHWSLLRMNDLQLAMPMCTMAFLFCLVWDHKTEPQQAYS